MTCRRSCSLPLPTSFTPFPDPCRIEWKSFVFRATHEAEKLEIAKRYLVEKQRPRNGLKEKNLILSDRGHPGDHPELHPGVGRSQSGTRDCLGLSQRRPQGGPRGRPRISVQVDREALSDYLGVIRFRNTRSAEKSEVGLATGLAWTEVCGEVLITEATLMEGKGRLTLTGKLGEVMQESAQAAMELRAFPLPHTGSSSGVSPEL